MGLDCLSTVSILRCEQFSQIQTVGLLIPTIIEVIFSTALLFTNRSSTKRQHLWITAEGWTYFALTLIEVIMHGVPAGRMNQATMKGLDIFIGATSVLPIFFYMFFIFVFLRADFMDSLPSRFRTTLAVLLLLFIPTVAALSELASFLGVCYRVGSGIKSTFPLVVGFRTAKDEVVWTFFTSVTLALLTIYQIIAFCLSFFRLTRVFLHQKKIEVDEKDEAHHFRGIAWIAGGFKLGAIETVVGFTDMGFGSAVTRRLLRMLARAFLCIGIARGVDIVEDFEKVRQEMSSWRQTDFRRSRLRELISNPRFSTFRQLTPTATAFHTAPRAPQVTSSLYERYAEQNAFKAAPKQSPEKEPSRLVSVKFDNVGTPRLDLGRFSSFGFPLSLHRAEPLPPPISVWSSDSSPQQAPSSREVVSQVPSPAQAPSVLSNLVITELGHETQLKSFSPVSPTHAKSNRKYSRAESSYSVKSWDTSFSAVRELTSQFPTLPSSVVPPAEQPQPADFWDDSSVTSPNSSASDRPKESRDTNTLRIPEAARVTETSPVPILRTNETTSSPSTVTDESVASQKRERGVSFLDVGDPTPTRARSVNPAEWIDYDSIPPAKRRSVLHPIAEGNDEEAPSVMEDEGGVRESGASFGTYHISWLRNPISIQEERRQARRMIKKPDGARVMSVGSAPMRSRPSVVRKEYTRGSLHLTPITIPPNSQTNTELVQGSYDTVGGKSVLRDSEVLGVEDGRYNRQMEERGYI